MIIFFFLMMLMSNLKKLLVERISAGIRQRSISDPAKWAKTFRIMGRPFSGKWTFRHHPWLEEMHRSRAEINVGQKAAQVGFTETVLNITFYKIDVESVDCLYVLPSKNPDAGEFSAGRFDPALELSPHLSTLFSDVKNVGHKRAGSTNLYIRGSKSRSGLMSIPVGFVVLDEVDEMNQENLSLARERMSGQKTKLEWLVSTATIENYGINKYYLESTQEEFYFNCPHCSRFINLTFPESLEITAQSLDDESINNSYIKCKLCSHPLHHKTKPDFLANGQWVPNYKQRSMRGFHINQLYASTVAGTPVELARAYIRSLSDPADEQIFWNNKIGIPHQVAGSKISDHQLECCKGNYLNGSSESNTRAPIYNRPSIITMGIDVGKWLHYEVDAWYLQQDSIDINKDSKCRVLEVGKVNDFTELDNIMHKYKVMSAVIDANPERRKAFEFAARFFGHVKMCFYGAGLQGKQINTPSTSGYSAGDSNEPTITVNRTSWLDLSLGRFRNNTIIIPLNSPLEYKDQLKALTRIYEKDKDGNPVGRYVRGNNPDHYAHARNYAEIALVFAASIMSPQSIRSPI